MRIGIDATALPPRLYGAGNYITHLIGALLELETDHEFVIFTKSRDAPLFEGKGRARLVRLPFTSRLRRIVWEQVSLPRLTRQQRLDVLHSPHYTLPFAASCATVVTFHDLTFFVCPETHLLYKRVFFQTMIPQSARRADALIAISQSTRADILRILRTPPDKVVAIPYGVAPLFQPITDARALDAFCREHDMPRPFVLYVGNLEPRKNLTTLVRAFARLVERGAPHTLVLAGARGWKDDEIFATVRELGLGARVRFPGFFEQEQLPALYSAADAFVYPALYEGFGLPVLEALACGAPVITSNVSSLPEIVGDAGILVNPRDVAELADALHVVITDRARRESLARAGLAQAKRFSWSQCARDTLAVYERAAQKYRR